MTATPFAPNARAWDLDHLRVFSLVARRASFVAAATELGMSPAYVSKRVAELERALGVVLFHRTTRRVLISEAGEAALGWSQRVLEAADHQSADVWAVTAARLDQTVRLKVCLGFLIERLKAGSWALDTTVG